MGNDGGIIKLLPSLYTSISISCGNNNRSETEGTHARRTETSLSSARDDFGNWRRGSLTLEYRKFSLANQAK